MEISSRQALIMEFISNNPDTQTQSIRDYLAKLSGEDISRMTVIRDVEILLKNKFIQKAGSGRSVAYKVTAKGKLLSPVSEYEAYFQKSPDERSGAKKSFQLEVFKNMEYLFSQKELSDLDKINSDYQKRISNFSPVALRKEFERLTIELSWKSSQLEGNTYSLIDTEVLLLQEKEAKGHKREEAIMLINHKKALEYIHENAKKFKKITLRDIEDVHSLIVDQLGIKRGLRKNVVGVIGSAYRPLDNEFQIKEAMEQMVKTANELPHPLQKTLAFILLLSYIQPFEDGNKRTARLFGNAILMANNCCPLSYRSVDEAEYKKAMLLFYEKNSAWMFKKIFTGQFKFAVRNYFLA